VHAAYSADRQAKDNSSQHYITRISVAEGSAGPE
jgi:hypothetical protein